MSQKNNKYSESMGTAADILTKGGTLIKEPCDACKGVQVRLKNKLTCVNCGRVKDINEPNSLLSQKLKVDSIIKNTKEPSQSRRCDTALNSEFGDIGITRIRSRILELITGIHENEKISEELSRAQLICIYIEILEKLSA
ncbi:MAG TPA: Sjogren's syndrome/scleroderma autoantigen 1 family protein [Nitrososphaeraceae archaeon]